jgi:hypothetical protein
MTEAHEEEQELHFTNRLNFFLPLFEMLNFLLFFEMHHTHPARPKGCLISSFRVIYIPRAKSALYNFTQLFQEYTYAGLKIHKWSKVPSNVNL